SSRLFCTIGGNVATKASGLRSLKYGSVDAALKSLRFIDTKHGLVDTSEQLPEDLEKEIIALRNRLLVDPVKDHILDSRENLKSSSGYNLKSFYQYDDPKEIVTHLLAGSVGTLAVFTEIELEAVPTPRETMLYLLFFTSVVDAARDAAEVKRFGASAVELVDRYGLDVIANKGVVDVPAASQALLLVEFDNNLEKTENLMANHVRQKSIAFKNVQDAKAQAIVWEVRETMLLRILNTLETADEKFPSFADDVAVPPERLPDFVAAIQTLMGKFGTRAVFFGHAGEGNLHIRPMVKKENWADTLRELADQIFKTTLMFGGTITSEHGNGRNRSLYLRSEWGDKIYGYFEEVKRIFDPSNVLNPGVVFTTDDVTKNLQL
ncbi:MAG TPA: FAD-linked oxidase C-terminal domain-containing protein, partial [Candidatus Nanoarchaeia archaeon]|nr:FAD-linked oxidase C-terminal domain-containing protein [Candidatus Nanoarchaeia archaeon]